MRNERLFKTIKNCEAFEVNTHSKSKSSSLFFMLGGESRFRFINLQVCKVHYTEYIN